MRRIVLCALVAAALVASPAKAAVYVVNTPGDAGDGVCGTQCTVRDAVVEAAQNPTRDTIRVPRGPFQLTQGALPLSGDVLAGAGARATSIRGNGTASVFVVTTANTEVAGVTLTNGGGQNQTGDGGAVLVMGTPASLTLRGVTISGSHAIDGGGVANSGGTLMIIGSTISGNTATSVSAFGGGVASFGGTTRIFDSTISGNVALDTDGNGFGGGVYGDNAVFELRGVTIAGNSASTEGAALYLAGTSTATVSNTIVSDSTVVPACGGNTPSADHSIANDVTCEFTTANPQIGALANNGGQTNTHALAPTSPARNAGAGCSAADQRGIPRDGACDIGAFEYFRPRLTVFKRVVNDQGGTQGPGDFTVHVRAGANDVGGSPQPGTASGRTYVLAPGTYTVGENADSRYSAAFSGGCNTSGVVTVAEGQSKTCTITNADIGPEANKHVNAVPKGGTVKIKLPGRKRFRRLREGEQLPMGTIVNTLNGRVTLIAAANKSGGLAKADFYDGIFKLTQTKGSKPITVLTLVEKLRGCKTKGKATTAAKRKRKRRLWGDGRGRFRTKGRNSAATVLGTKWLVEDRCTSTLTRVRRGKVKVRDFVKKKTVTVKAGKRYVARAKP